MQTSSATTSCRVRGFRFSCSPPLYLSHFTDLEAQRMIDEAYVDRPAWISKVSFPLRAPRTALSPFSDDPHDCSHGQVQLRSCGDAVRRRACPSVLVLLFAADPFSLRSQEIWNVEPLKIPNKVFTE